MNGYVYFCNDCSETFLYQSLCGSTIDKHARRCPYCGSRWITEHHLNDMKWSRTDKTVEEKKKPMNLSQFSDKMREYEADLSPCPFCNSDEDLVIRVVDMHFDDDSDDSDDYKAFRIECEECNLKFDSDPLDTNMFHEGRYEEALKKLSEHCQRWDMRGEDIPDDE